MLHESGPEVKVKAMPVLPAGLVVDSRFELLELIGEGTMSVVYKARDMQLNRDVALKILREELIVDSEAINRLQRESVAVCTLEHPGIVKVFSAGTLGTQPYVAMEFIEGTSLGALLQEKAPLPRAEALPIFTQILDALAHAHAHGIIHRDLKPNNIMLLGQDRKVKIVDFGIAKVLPESGKELQALTQTGQLVGSLNYMSPEQCMGFPVTAGSDIYSFGCLMYETLTGQQAVYGTTDYAVIARHMKESPKKSDLLDDAFGQVVLGALNKDPQLRPQSAEELKEALLNPKRFKSGKKRPGSRMRIALVAACVAMSGLAYFMSQPISEKSMQPAEFLAVAEHELRSGRMADALRTYELTSQQSKARGDALTQLAADAGAIRVHAAQGHDVKALEKGAQLLDLYARNVDGVRVHRSAHRAYAEALEALAMSAVDEHKYADAERYWRELSPLCGEFDRAKVNYYLGLSRLAQGERDGLLDLQSASRGQFLYAVLSRKMIAWVEKNPHASAEELVHEARRWRREVDIDIHAHRKQREQERGRKYH